MVKTKIIKGLNKTQGKLWLLIEIKNSSTIKERTRKETEKN